jgi:sporulation protein YlmC with PRC-barrel domain
MTTEGSAMSDRNSDIEEESFSLVPASKIEGVAIIDHHGVKVGTITDVMIEKRTGRVAYLVLSVGSVFGGMGEHLYPMPWNKLREWNELEGAYVVEIDEETLRRAPRFHRDNYPDVGDRAWSFEVHEYYGVAPAWR